MIVADHELGEIPAAQIRRVAMTLNHYQKQQNDRNVAIIGVYVSGGYSMAEIGRHFGLHCSRISRIINRQEKEKGKI